MYVCMYGKAAIDIMKMQQDLKQRVAASSVDTENDENDENVENDGPENDGPEISSSSHSDASHTGTQ